MEIAEFLIINKVTTVVVIGAVVIGVIICAKFYKLKKKTKKTRI